MSDPRAGLLEQLLDEASKVEHCMLNTYLFAACSRKSLHAEFATLPDGRANRRRAVGRRIPRCWKAPRLWAGSGFVLAGFIMVAA